MIRTKNHSDSLPFQGWRRTNVDFPSSSNPRIRIGRRTGRSTYAADVWIDLNPGQEATIDPAAADPAPPSVPIPADLLAHFGGMLQVDGVPMHLLSLRPDGASHLIHCRLRVGRMFCVDFVGLWNPELAGVIDGELLVTCSNPTVADMGEELPDLRLSWGDAEVFALCGMLRPGMPFFDGQARAIPLTFVWKRHLRTALEQSTAAVVAQKTVSAVGVRGLPLGVPKMVEGFQVSAWWWRFLHTGTNLSTWAHPELGPAANTAQGGGQEDQIFVGGECWAPNGLGAEILTLFAAYGTSGHPCHHLELDGSVVDAERRPGLRMFHSRPHQTGSDLLGKPRLMQAGEAMGWAGPDAQHWLIGRLSAGAHLTGSPVLQRLLEHHARNYLIQLTTTPGWATSAIWSAREILWEALLVRQLYECLEDQELASRVLDHAEDRVRRIMLPRLSGRGGRWVKIREDSVGPGVCWQAWQHAGGAFGLALLGRIPGLEEARQVALECALRCLEDGWRLEGDRWVQYGHLGISDPDYRSSDRNFNVAWQGLAIVTVLEHQPDNAKALAIWQQLKADAAGEERWLPPGWAPRQQ